MGNSYSLKNLIIVTILIFFPAIFVNAQQQETENVDEIKVVTKTRTELLNELSLRSAQLAKEHAQEEYERYEKPSVTITGKNTRSSPPKQADLKENSAQYKGLCQTCEYRETCTYPKPEGGVWHCEEYM